jgi:Domain of unknown function (DUF4439)
MTRQAGSTGRLGAEEIAALQAALAAEQAACYGYGVVGARLNASAPGGQGADADWVAHQVARDNLTALITAAGATPVPAPVAYQLPIQAHTAAQAKSLAVILEDNVAQACMGLVGLSDKSLRALGARELTAASLRAARWRRTTVAFPGLTTDGQDSPPAESLRG